MTTKEYRTKSNLLSGLYLIPFFGVSIAVLLIVSGIDIWISHRVTLDRGFVFLISAPFMCGGFILGRRFDENLVYIVADQRGPRNAESVITVGG
jgi:hypothetical protein